MTGVKAMYETYWHQRLADGATGGVARLVVAGRFPHTASETCVWGGGHLHYFTRRDLRGLLAAAGLVDVEFQVNRAQFARSWKRRWARRLMGDARFGEWLCAGIFARAVKA